MSPVTDDLYVADLAADFGFPLVVVARNALGTINHTLLTVQAAANFHPPLRVAGIVLNEASPPSVDPSRASNLRELQSRCTPPVLGYVRWQANRFEQPVDWASYNR
jgi:dethiobiotin synthetase